jgi:hypothetical protein
MKVKHRNDGEYMKIKKYLGIRLLEKGCVSDKAHIISPITGHSEWNIKFLFM